MGFNSGFKGLKPFGNPLGPNEWLQIWSGYCGEKKPPASEGNQIPGSSVPWPTRCTDCCYPRSMRDSNHNGAVHITTSFCRPCEFISNRKLDVLA